MDFASFKAGHPAQIIFRKMGLEEHLAEATSWRHLRINIVAFNACDEGNFVKIAKRCDGVCSSGERILLHAILYVTDFAWLADKLSKGKTWQNMDRASGEWQRAIAACIAAEC